MATIRIRLKDWKWYEVDGEMVGETIAITPVINEKHEYTKLWDVTHTPTGATFINGGTKKASALAIATALVKLGFDGVHETHPEQAVAKMRKRGDIHGFMADVKGRPPATVEQIARAYGRKQSASPPPRAVSVKPTRTSKPARTPTPKPKAAAKRKPKSKAPPNLLALARRAREGRL